MAEKKIAIIGAGIAGLACLHQFQKNNTPHTITLFERESFAGGRIRSWHGYANEEAVELGAGYFHQYYHHTLALIHELGLQHRIQPKGKSTAGFLHDGKLSVLNTMGILRACLDGNLSIKDVLSLIRVFLTARKNAGTFSLLVSDSDIEKIIDNTWYKTASSLPGAQFTASLSPAIHDFLNAVSRKQVFQTFDEMKLTVGILLICSVAVTLYTLRGGMDWLPKTLAEKYAAYIHYETAIQHANYQNDRWFLSTVSGEQPGPFDSIVFALPVPVAQRIIGANSSLAYVGGTVLVVKGKLKKALDKTISIYIHPVTHGVFGITRYHEDLFKLAVSDDYSLEPYFSEATIMMKHEWKQVSPALRASTPPVPATLFHNCFLIGDYFMPCMEASIISGYYLANHFAEEKS